MGLPEIQAQARANAGYTLPAAADEEEDIEVPVGNFSTEEARMELLSRRTEGRRKKDRRRIGENARCAGEVADRRAMDSIHAAKLAHARAVETTFFPQGTESDIGNDAVLVTLRTAKLSKRIGGALAGERLQRPVFRVHARSESVQNEVLGSLAEAMTQGNDGEGDARRELHGGWLSC